MCACVFACVVLSGGCLHTSASLACLPSACLPCCKLDTFTRIGKSHFPDPWRRGPRFCSLCWRSLHLRPVVVAVRRYGVFSVSLSCVCAGARVRVSLCVLCVCVCVCVDAKSCVCAHVLCVCACVCVSLVCGWVSASVFASAACACAQSLT